MSQCVTVTLVVAMGTNGVIGAAGGIPWHLPADLANFKASDDGSPDGDGTCDLRLDRPPLAGPYDDRRDPTGRWSAPGVLVAPSLPDALRQAAELDDEIFLVGGAQIYAEALDAGLVDSMVVTRVELAPDGDTYFPEVDWDDWIVGDPRGPQPTVIAAFTITRFDRAA